VVGRKQLEPYDSLRSQILSFIEKRGMRERVVDEKLDSLVKAYAGKKSKEQILDDKSDEMSSVNPQLRYLIQEYHDGLLLYEISNREVWDKASKDEVGLNRYFKKNKKKYRWSDPRFRGIVYHVKSPEMLGKVKSCIKELPFERWAEVLRTTFNGDSVIRVRADKGLFKRGDNAYVDSIIFKKDTTVQAVRDYPYTAAYGKLLKKGPKEMQDVRGLVVADYQDALETEWVEKLRSKYSVIINKEVLSTVNKHN
jgi:peptidyl-prolyl cis-trans isomerase SurA